MQLGSRSRVRQALIIVVLIVICLTIFWGQSRYPELNAKSLSSESFDISNLINFVSIITIDPEDNFFIRITYGLLNWASTNRNGMLFGLTFSSLLMSFLKLVHFKKFDSRFFNVLLGVLIGAPLGVCVNCSSPIGYSLYKSGRSLLTSISTVISSPTLNIVVLTMSFTLFPIYIGVIRIIAIVLLIFFFIPISIKERNDEHLENETCLIASHNSSQSLFEDIFYSLKSIVKDFILVCIRTVPLMILAGLIGSAIIEFLPSDFSSLKSLSLPGLFILIITSLALPSPMALDVFVGSALLGSGVPSYVVLPLMLSLGTFSAYAFFIVKKISSFRVALKITFFVYTLSLLSSLIVYNYEENVLSTMKDSLNTAFIIEKKPQNVEFSVVKYDNIEYSTRPYLVGTDFIVNSVDLLPRSTKGSFVRHSGVSKGITYDYSMSLKEFLPPFYTGVGIASEDLNNDKMIDIVIPRYNKIYLYMNIGKLKFIKKELELDEEHHILDIKIVDINSDGQEDLVFSSYKNGVFYLLNESGQYSAKKATKLPNLEYVYYTNNLNFADIDNDGDLDIFLGNFSLGFLTQSPGPPSKDVILINDFPNFTLMNIPGVPSETHSSLFFDFNKDGHLDIFIGNDFDVPDQVLINNDGKSFSAQNEESFIKAGGSSTMSISQGDIDNDGNYELYLGQISASLSPMFPQVIGQDDYCDKDDFICKQNISVKKLLNFKNSISNQKCSGLTNINTKKCLRYSFLFSLLKKPEIRKCQDLHNDNFLFDYCMKSVDGNNYKLKNSHTNGYLSNSLEGQNILYKYNGHIWNTYSDKGAIYGGWSWNSVFNDYNNDSFLDLYIANGFWYNSSFPTNILYMNFNEKFVDKTKNLNATEYKAVSAYLSDDFDNDGDIDLFYLPIGSSPVLLENQINTKNSIQFLLDISNTYAKSGGELIIHYNGKTQRRLLLEGEGFKSDPSRRIYFGLGDSEGVEKVEVHLYNKKVIIDKKLEANKLYIINI